MPIYEYQCENCEKVHEVMQKFSDAPMKECPECQAVIAAGFATCPQCGFVFPPPERKRALQPGHARQKSRELGLNGPGDGCFGVCGAQGVKDGQRRHHVPQVGEAHEQDPTRFGHGACEVSGDESGDKDSRVSGVGRPRQIEWRG